MKQLTWTNLCLQVRDQICPVKTFSQRKIRLGNFPSAFMRSRKKEARLTLKLIQMYTKNQVSQNRAI